MSEQQPTTLKGFVLCVAGPSGSGKTSLCDKLARELPQACRSISMTTRPQRPAEKSGDDYHFVSREEFLRMKEADLFLETAEVFGNWYGTPLRPVEDALREGKIMVMDLDTVGTEAVLSRLGKRCVRVFIMPPSLKELERRLRERRQNDPSDLERRLAEAKREMLEGMKYENIIENRDFDQAYRQLCDLVEKAK
jgi:guanylate kinase